MAQNRSHAVMAQRTEAKISRDVFPTPPWATRGLFEHVISEFGPFANQSALEPACGAGHMAKVLQDYFSEVHAADVHPYGFGTVRDFLAAPYKANSVDWVITNPPFRLAEEFVQRSLVLRVMASLSWRGQSSLRASAAIVICFRKHRRSDLHNSQSVSRW